MKELAKEELHKLLDNLNIDAVQKARRYFFEVEGYMSTDNQCVELWSKDKK